MKLIRRDYDFAGTTTMLAGLMHIPHFLWQGWNLSTQTLLIYGLVFLAIGWFLRKRLRWLAYLYSPARGNAGNTDHDRYGHDRTLVGYRHHAVSNHGDL